MVKVFNKWHEQKYQTLWDEEQFSKNSTVIVEESDIKKKMFIKAFNKWHE